MDDQKQPSIQTTHVGNFSVSYANRAEFLSIKSEIFMEKCYAPIKCASNDEPVIVDIGSHIGLSVLYFKEIAPKAKIFAYEPVPKLFDLMEINVLSNNLQDVTMVNAAVSTINGEIEMFLSHDKDFWYSNSSVYANSWTGRVDTDKIIVDTISIMEVLRPHAYVDLLKIDVEGYELKLLENVDFPKVGCIMIEYHPVNKNRLRKIQKLLKSKGYSLFYHYRGNLSENPPPGDELCIIHASKHPH